MRRPALPAAVAVAVSLAAATARPAVARAIAVEGNDRARLLAPAGTHVEAYQNFGYRLRVDGDQVEVEVDVEPLGSQSPFVPRPARRSASPIAELATRLTADARVRFDAVSRVLTWVAGNIAYDLDRTADQDPIAVLERRTAYCSGFAALTVALLESLDIPAREVAGYVIEDGSAGRGSGFHRWIEVKYPDRGWVFSDPLASHHFVPASYVRLAQEDLSQEPGEALLLERADRIRDVDLLPLALAADVRMRTNRTERTAAALELTIDARRGRGAEAVLEGLGLRRVASLAAGRATFLGLEPGRYELRVTRGGRVEVWKQVVFRDRVLAELEVGLAAASAAPRSAGGR